MQETFDHIRKIAFGFFAGLGLIHFIAGFLYAQHYWPSATFLINRVVFVPFFVAAYTFVLTQFLYTMGDYDRYKSWQLYGGIAIGAVLFIGLILIEVSNSDRLIPLIYSSL